jgi:hypothetical protein
VVESSKEMSGKLKGLLAVLSLGAIASGVYFWSILRNPSHVTALADPTILQAQALGLLEPPRDTDKDGLPDSEETYWEADFQKPDTDGDGFLDGEEVLSGHNPAVKGPDDWLDHSKNLTKRVTELMVGGILAGDLKPGNANYDTSVDSLVEDVIEKYRENRGISVDDIILTSADGPAERFAYISQMGWIIKGVFAEALGDADKFLESVADLTWSDPTALTENPKRYVAFATAARKLAQVSGERAVKVAALPVPRVFAVQHKDAIRILRTLQRDYELAATVKDDQLQGMAALQDIVRLHTETLPAFLAGLAENFAHILSSTDAR